MYVLLIILECQAGYFVDITSFDVHYNPVSYMASSLYKENETLGVTAQGYKVNK